MSSPTSTYRILVAPLVVAVALAGGAVGQQLEESVAKAIDDVCAPWASPDAPGAAVAVYRRGAVVYAKGFGAASLEHSVPVAPSTVFDLGSTSKQFTAACVLLLEADGALSLDDPVRKHVPELPPWAEKATLRHLLHHTSGVRDYTTLLMLDGSKIQDRTTSADALAALGRQRGLSFEPGLRHDYSNSGYFLLAQVVERAAKARFAAFAEERIFKPLGMTDTRVLDDCTAVIPRRAASYVPARGGFAVAASDWEQTGDGAVQSTVLDLAKWDANFFTGAVGGARLLERLSERGRLGDGTEIGYGFGLMHETRDGRRLVSHGGAWAGFRAELARLPDDGWSVAVLANRADADVSGVARKILRLAAPPANDAATASRPARSRIPESRPAAATAPSSSNLEAYAGTYVSDEAKFPATLVVEGRMLKFAGGPLDGVRLGTSSKDVFLSLDGFRLTFERDAADRPVRFVVRTRGLDGLVYARRP